MGAFCFFGCGLACGVTVVICVCVCGVLDGSTLSQTPLIHSPTPHHRLQEMRRERLELDEAIDAAYKAVRLQQDAKKAQELEARLAKLEAEGDRLDEAIKAACLDYHFKFHPVWGKLFEAGFQESRFAKQVKTYACIYTSKASNLGLISPERWHRSTRDYLPHDYLLGI